MNAHPLKTWINTSVLKYYLGFTVCYTKLFDFCKDASTWHMYVTYNIAG
jgi:hypothetical protein